MGPGDRYGMELSLLVSNLMLCTGADCGLMGAGAVGPAMELALLLMDTDFLDIMARD